VTLTGKVEAHLRSLFHGWDLVEVRRMEDLSMTQVRLLVTDQSYLDVRGRRFRPVHLSSRATEEALTKTSNGLRFYGRRSNQRNRYR
jgi:hypothetical protein